MEWYTLTGKSYILKDVPTVRIRVWQSVNSNKLAYDFSKVDNEHVSSDLYTYYFFKFADNNLVQNLNGWFLQRRLNKFAKENI